MSEVLRIASTIIKRISSWVRCVKCTRCLEDISSEKIVVHEKTYNKTNNDIENHEEHVNIHEPSSVIFRRPLDENIQNTIAISLGSDQQLKVEEKDGRNNKGPIKPPRKKLQTDSNNITDGQITCLSEKVKVPLIIVTTEGSNNCLLSSSKSQNVSRSLLTSFTKSSSQMPQKSSSYLDVPVPSKNMLTSTKIDSKSDLKKLSIIIKLRNLLSFRKTPKERKNE
ncbi:uncharacterized protein LOC116853581 [Odontomachus brunneus]|uniref:uncharacterized protein LOC116853581 n=1 Tax=Odontomachus brunneus TaxID=486640 RepID=UPI0013F18441|nr:uncharacterized protein LOC116853581 [Odontomachus brunneus]